MTWLLSLAIPKKVVWGQKSKALKDASLLYQQERQLLGRVVNGKESFIYGFLHLYLNSDGSDKRTGKKTDEFGIHSEAGQAWTALRILLIFQVFGDIKAPAFTRALEKFHGDCAFDSLLTAGRESSKGTERSHGSAASISEGGGEEEEKRTHRSGNPQSIVFAESPGHLAAIPCLLTPSRCRLGKRYNGYGDPTQFWVIEIYLRIRKRLLGIVRRQSGLNFVAEDEPPKEDWQSLASKTSRKRPRARKSWQSKLALLFLFFEAHLKNLIVVSIPLCPTVAGFCRLLLAAPDPTYNKNTFHIEVYQGGTGDKLKDQGSNQYISCKAVERQGPLPSSRAPILD
ncbi:hypothetical protein C8J56DRAFT_1032887 [Mycena floridula]|nr:hypothetical protein C8J56DRAFT_1032887 [Mycena floridula]